MSREDFKVEPRQIQIGNGGFPIHPKRWRVAKLSNRRAGYAGVSITGENRTFYHWRNVCRSIQNLRGFCGELLAGLGIEAQIGYAVDAQEVAGDGTLSFYKTTKQGREVFGIYVDEEDLSLVQLIRGFPDSLIFPRDFSVRGGQRL